MASVTLAEAQKLGQDDLVSGVIENIVTVNPIFQVLPFREIDGNSLRYNREKVLGDVQTLAIGGTVTAKAAATFKKKNTDLTTIIGDAEVNGLITSQGIGEDQVAIQIASKAKSVGRKYQDLMINGNSGSDATQFDGLRAICATINSEADNDQIVAAGGGLSFAKLDELLHSVKSKDGYVDYLMFNSRDIRALRVLYRALGGASIETVSINGVQYESYAGVPIFRNDWIPTNLGVGTNESVIFAGNFDDGTDKVGLSGLTAAGNMGIHVQAIGASETKDMDIYRVKFYSGLAVFNELGIAMLDGITG